MVVYAEYLFLENFITSLVLVYFTSRLTGTAAKWYRLVAGAVLGGISSFLLFLPMGAAAAVLTRGAAAVVICGFSLGGVNLWRKTAVFFILSFLSGGAAVAVFFWQQIPVLMGNGILYMESMTYVMLVSCGLPALAATGWFIRLVKRKRRLDSTTGEVELVLKEQVCRLRAYVDSGNCLREPVTGKPVILVDEKGCQQLPFRKEDYPERFTVIPYRTVGVEEGMLTGIRIDRIRYEEIEYEGVILAYFGGQFEDFEVLLNREVLGGGLLDHG